MILLFVVLMLIISIIDRVIYSMNVYVMGRPCAEKMILCRAFSSVDHPVVTLFTRHGRWRELETEH